MSYWKAQPQPGPSHLCLSQMSQVSYVPLGRAKCRGQNPRLHPGHWWSLRAASPRERPLLSVTQGGSAGGWCLEARIGRKLLAPEGTQLVKCGQQPLSYPQGKCDALTPLSPCKLLPRGDWELGLDKQGVHSGTPAVITSSSSWSRGSHGALGAQGHTGILNSGKDVEPVPTGGPAVSYHVCPHHEWQSHRDRCPPAKRWRAFAVLQWQQLHDLHERRDQQVPGLDSSQSNILFPLFHSYSICQEYSRFLQAPPMGHPLSPFQL